jgi:hypothetical protein
MQRAAEGHTCKTPRPRWWWALGAVWECDRCETRWELVQAYGGGGTWIIQSTAKQRDEERHRIVDQMFGGKQAVPPLTRIDID